MNDDELSVGIGEILDYSIKEIDMLSPLILAYIGDSVYDVYVRTSLLQEKATPVHQMHKRTICYVKAEAQAKIVHAIWESLSDKEKGIIKRGRNAKTATVPKNADITDYRYATSYNFV